MTPLYEHQILTIAVFIHDEFIITVSKCLPDYSITKEIEPDRPPDE